MYHQLSSWLLGELYQTVNRIERRLEEVVATWQDIAAELKDEVAQRTTIDSSIKQLLDNMAAQLADLNSRISDSTDISAIKAEIESYVTALQQERQNITAVVTANTPAPASPPASPTPVPPVDTSGGTPAPSAPPTSTTP